MLDNVCTPVQSQMIQRVYAGPRFLIYFLLLTLLHCPSLPFPQSLAFTTMLSVSMGYPYMNICVLWLISFSSLVAQIFNLSCKGHYRLHPVYKRISRGKCKYGFQLHLNQTREVPGGSQKRPLSKTPASLPVPGTSCRDRFAGQRSSLPCYGKEQGQGHMCASSRSEGARMLYKASLGTLETRRFSIPLLQMK